MKLRQVRSEGRIILGIETALGMVDVAAEAARRGLQAPADMLELIGAGKAGLPARR